MTLRWLTAALLAGTAGVGSVGAALAADMPGSGAFDAAADTVKIIPIAGTPSTATPTGSDVRVSPPLAQSDQAVPTQGSPAQGGPSQGSPAMAPVPDTAAPSAPMPGRGMPTGSPTGAAAGAPAGGAAQPGATAPALPGLPARSPSRNIPPDDQATVPARPRITVPVHPGAATAGTAADQRHRAAQERDRAPDGSAQANRWTCRDVKLVYSWPNPDGTLTVKMQNTAGRAVTARAEFRARGYPRARSEPRRIEPGAMQDFTISGVGGGFDNVFAYDHTGPVGCSFGRR